MKLRLLSLKSLSSLATRRAAYGCQAKWLKLPSTPTREFPLSRCWPSCGACMRAACKPVATAPLVDAAAASVVASGSTIKAHGKKPLARVVAVAAVGVPPEILGIGPAPAIRLLLERCGLKLDDIGCFEINEAQGAQTLAVAKELGLDIEKLNVNGGAIALGHPLAATGVRLTLTLARQIQLSGVRYGISSACVGGGQGIALLLENPQSS